MAKETKLGLIVVVTLLVVFGVLLVRRVLKSSDVTGAPAVAESNAARQPSTDEIATTPASDTVVISAVSGGEAPGSKLSTIDDPHPHHAHRRWPHSRDEHQHQSADSGQSTAGQVFLPPAETVAADEDRYTTRPALHEHVHQDHAVQAVEQQPAEFQFARQSAPTAQLEQTAAPDAARPYGSGDPQPRYPVATPQPIHESNYRQDPDLQQRQPPSYRDDLQQASAPYQQSVQQSPLVANQQRDSEFSDTVRGTAGHSHPQSVEFASHRQQHAHPPTHQQQQVGQIGGHHHGQHLPSPSAVGGVHVVRPNDNFWEISKSLYGSGDYFKALIEHNRERHPLPGRLSVGDKVLAPSLQVLIESYPDLCPKRRGQATAIAVSNGTVGRPGREYVVREGDTLFDIARYEMGNGSQWVEIYNLNKQLMTEDFDYLKPGTRIALPARVRRPIDRTAQQPGEDRLR